MVLADSSVIVFTSPVFTFFLVSQLHCLALELLQYEDNCSDIVMLLRVLVCFTNTLTFPVSRVRCYRLEA